MNHLTPQVTLRSTFHAAHRLPQLAGKCSSLHGHTWRATVTVTTRTLDDDNVVADFALVKGALADFTDTYFDHGTILGASDPAAAALNDVPNQKLYLVGAGPYSHGLAWPTVESVSMIVYRAMKTVMSQHPLLNVTSVSVQETDNNTATWTHDA